MYSPDQPDTADEFLFTSVLQKRTSDVGVVLSESTDDLMESQSIRHEFGRICQYLKLLFLAAKAIDLNDAWNGTELRLDEPVQLGAQVHEGVTPFPGYVRKGELIDFTKP